MAGENTQLGTLTFKVTAGAGQTSLTIDRGPLDADHELAEANSSVETKGGVIDIAGSVNAWDLNCGGVVAVAGALVALKYGSAGKYVGFPAALLRVTPITARYGETSTQTAWLTPATRSRSCSPRPTSPEAC